MVGRSGRFVGNTVARARQFSALAVAVVVSLLMVGATVPAASAADRFSDVPAGTQFYAEIEWTAAQGISTGWDDGTYRPAEAVNRDAMAAFMYRLAGSPTFPEPTAAPFTDVPLGTQFAKEMAWMKAVGVSTGWEDGTYRPAEAVNRDAMAAFMFRLGKTLAVDPPAISAGGLHTCAVTSAGGAKCWGYNFYGQVGDGTTTSRAKPTDVTGLTADVAAVSAAYSHSCALTSTGGVKCWGSNLYGQLGDGTTTNRLTPVDVAGLTSGVVAIGAGRYHTCAVTTAGGVSCWGSNLNGQLGDGTTTDQLTPVPVSGLTSEVVAVSAGTDHTCALTATGGVTCWGTNGSGQLGDGTTTDRSAPADVTGLTSGVTTISSGTDFTCAITSTGGAKCWGLNDNGQLGDGSTTSRPLPADVTGLTSGVTAISADWAYACAVTATGEGKCWGGTNEPRLTPENVTGLPFGLVGISAGRHHTCATRATGGAMCWGDNYHGQLGDGTFADSWTPVNVLGLG